MIIEQIKIMLNLNIPNQKNLIELTNDLLYYKKTSTYELSKYPYFSYSFKYISFYISKLKYEKIVRFFFNKAYMKKKIKKWNLSEELSFKHIEHNIEVMIKLLFPTTFPTINNYETSFDKYISPDKPLFISTLFNDDERILVNLFKYVFNSKTNKSNKFSFLKVNGKIYTVTKIIWLNDFYNHPIYYDFYKNYNNLIEWADKENEKIHETISQKLKLVSQKLKSLNINHIKELLVPIENSIRIYKEIEDLDAKINILNQQFNKNYNHDKLVKELTYTKDNKKVDYSDELNKLNEELQNKDGELSTSSDNIINQSYIFEKNIYKTQIPNNKLKEIKNIINIIHEIEVLLTITNKYIKKKDNNNKININYNYESLNVKQVLNTYEYFIKFTKLVYNIVKPTRESHNINLQKILSNYVYNIDDNSSEFSSIINCLTNFDNKTNVCQHNKLLKVGLSFINYKQINVPKYEIYLNIDLIEGQLNEVNYKDIYCKYKEIYIKNEIEFYTKQHKAVHGRIFVSLKDFQNKQNTVKKQNGGLKKRNFTLKKR